MVAAKISHHSPPVLRLTDVDKKNNNRICGQRERELEVNSGRVQQNILRHVSDLSTGGFSWIILPNE